MGYRPSHQPEARTGFQWDSDGMPDPNFCQANKPEAIMGCLWDSDGTSYLNNARHPTRVAAIPELQNNPSRCNRRLHSARISTEVDRSDLGHSHLGSYNQSIDRGRQADNEKYVSCTHCSTLIAHTKTNL